MAARRARAAAVEALSDWHAGDRIAGAQRRAARRLPQRPAGTRLRRRTDLCNGISLRRWIRQPLPELAAELVRLGVDLIVVRGTPAAIAAKNATGTIPIVMASVGEPLLVVDSLARPGRNVTGLSAFVTVMTSKRLEL